MVVSFLRPWLVAVVASISLVACAQGIGGAGDDDDDTPIDPRVDAATSSIDARVNPPIDAPVTPIDAPVSMPDAPMPPDGGGGGGLFCNVHTDCSTVTPGTCCLTLGMPPGLCTPGTEIGPLCLPN